MSLERYAEKLDSTRGIPRHANLQSLPAYQALIHWLGDILIGLSTILSGIASAVFLWIIANLLEVTFATRVYFMIGMAAVILLGCAEAAALRLPYLRAYQLTTYGSARWATLKDLLEHKILRHLKDNLPRGWIVLGIFKKKYQLVLPPSEWLRHLVFYGPTGSGKSKTFFMWLLRCVARGGSAVVVDPKPELYQQTAHHFNKVFRLDLKDPAYSDRWNFVPRCKEDPEFAHAMAAMMIGLEHTKQTRQDPFWGDAEHVACTAILMFLGTIVAEPTPPMVYEYVCLRDDNGFRDDMMNCDNHNVKLAWKAFQKAPPQTKGSVMIGLSNKLHPFFLENVQGVCAPITAKDRENGVQQIDFAELRKPGTAIYIVIPEGAATRYQTVLATFVGQGVLHLRDSEDGKQENGERTPVMFLIDEAYNIPVAEIKSVSGVGRERGVGLCLGYQDVSQTYEQYTKDGANAILGTLVTKIFLPGLDDVTAQYASHMTGQTTTLSHTTVDAPGKKFDNQRASETGRALKDPNEIRQMPKYKQALIVTDTVPPIKCAFPVIAVEKAESHPMKYGPPTLLLFEEAAKQFLEQKKRKRKEGRAVVAKDEAETEARFSATGPRGGGGGDQSKGGNLARQRGKDSGQGSLWHSQAIQEKTQEALEEVKKRGAGNITIIKKSFPGQDPLPLAPDDEFLNHGRETNERDEYAY